MPRIGFKKRVEMAKAIAKAQKEVTVSELAYMLDVSPQYAAQIAKSVADMDDEFEFDGHTLKWVPEKKG
jgi:ABC-type oligopeptide transport system ATPase subunit